MGKSASSFTLTNRPSNSVGGGGGDVRVSYPNANPNGLSDVENLQKIDNLADELNSYKKILLAKLSSGGGGEQQQQQQPTRLLAETRLTSCQSEKSLKSFLNGQVSGFAVKSKKVFKIIPRNSHEWLGMNRFVSLNIRV